MYLISVYFDDKTNRILQKYIDQVAEKTGNTFMTRNQVPPHMTVCQIEARNPQVLIPSMEKMKGKLENGEIQFVSVGMLLPYVLYVTPVLNRYLLELIESVYGEFNHVPETTISRYYQPMSWLPHVTLGKTLEKEEMTAAIRFLQDHFVPFTARIEEIGLAKVNPHEDILRFSLK